MKEQIKNFTKDLEEKINNKHKFTSTELSYLRLKISDFQHERLIHLLVTLFYSLFTITFLALTLISWIFIIPFLIVITFLLFYIRHYFFLENSVQYLYKLYDKVINKK